MWKRSTYLLLCYLCLQGEFKAPRSPEICYILAKNSSIQESSWKYAMFFAFFQKYMQQVNKDHNGHPYNYLHHGHLPRPLARENHHHQNHKIMINIKSSSIIIITTCRVPLVFGFLHWRGKAQLGKERHLGQRPEHKRFVVLLFLFVCFVCLFVCCCFVCLLCVVVFAQLW